MTKKEFIIRTLLPYKNDPGLCAIEDGKCVYLDSQGRKCAFGKWMKRGYWQRSTKRAGTVIKKYSEEKVLLKKALGVLTAEQWNLVQKIHDNIALEIPQSWNVCRLEELTGLDLDELK